MKALVRERISDWKIRFEQKLGKKVVELTGDITPDVRAIMQASVIVTTPEKWDAVSRSWQTRSFVQVFYIFCVPWAKIITKYCPRRSNETSDLLTALVNIQPLEGQTRL